MATHLKVVLLTCLLFLMVLAIGEIKPVLAKQGEKLKQRTKVLEESVKELQEKVKEQEETIKEQGEKVKELKECNACSKIKELNETLHELQSKIGTKPDIDECASGVHDCHSLASCTNTAGSFTCLCNHPFTGDGKTCSHPASECQNYQSLTSADRKVTYSNRTNLLCDDGLSPGWFRFQGAAGTRMPTSCPPGGRCSTRAPSWLNGGHPTVADGKVTRKVCFSFGSHCCYGFSNIQVRNCGLFYVYFLQSTDVCDYRYCGTD